MAVTNNIINKRAVAKITDSANKELTYMAGDEKITLSKAIVRNYLINGDSKNITDQEIVMFLMLCKGNHLNPWNREAYCIKYGNEPATMVIGKQAYFKRAESDPAYDGMSSGIIVFDQNSGEIEYRNGGFSMPDEQIVGGWAEVYRKDRSHPARIEVAFDEYAGRKKDGTLSRQWAAKPATMIRKVAQVQALREAFPNSVPEGIYTAEEQGAEEPEIAPIDNPIAATEKAPKTAKKAGKTDVKEETEGIIEVPEPSDDDEDLL